MMAPTLSAGAAAGAGGSLVAERNASLASCLVRSTNAICCDASTARAPLSPSPSRASRITMEVCAVSTASPNARSSPSLSPSKKKTNASTAISPTDFAKTIPPPPHSSLLPVTFPPRRGIICMGNFFQDLRYAFRSLRKAPLFTSVAVLSLALGIGANTAIFTLVNQLILQLLPVRDPEQLVLLTARGSHYGSNTGSNAISYPMYQDFRDKNQVFQGMFCRFSTSLSLTYEGRTELIVGELVSGNYFPVLGVGAALGRVFTAQDDLIQGGHPIAVLSYGYWKTRFAADPSVIGRKIVVNGYPLTIVGVSRQGFDGVEPGYAPQLRVPIMMKHQLTDQYYNLNSRRRRFAQVFGRLKPGVTLEQAKAGLQPLFHQILRMEVRERDFARTTEHTRQQFLKMWMDVLPAANGRSALRLQFSNPLLALMAIVALVLLIACSNVANLLIARATARQKEIAVRLALGAGRRRLILQLLEESLLLSAVGGMLGIGLAIAIDRALIGFLPRGVLPLTLSAMPDLSLIH